MPDPTPLPDTGPPTTYADAVEGIRAVMAAYAQALDDGRTDDIVATFMPDGVCEVPGMGVYEGHDALREAFAGWTPRQPQRHLVVNTFVTEWQESDARATSDIVFLLKGENGWSIQLVGRYHDVLRFAGGSWRFRRRTSQFLT